MMDPYIIQKSLLYDDFLDHPQIVEILHADLVYRISIQLHRILVPIVCR
jgi:hypothetical protein